MGQDASVAGVGGSGRYLKALERRLVPNRLDHESAQEARQI